MKAETKDLTPIVVSAHFDFAQRQELA